MKKIIITGALGYIGTELCKLYSGYSWKYEVIAIDNRFISERVNELKRRKIKFVQADILNLSEIKPHIKNADIIHHLAGITDVAMLPRLFSNDMVKPFTLFTRIATIVTDNVYNNVVRPAREGDITPLMRYVAGSAVGGALSNVSTPNK